MEDTYDMTFGNVIRVTEGISEHDHRVIEEIVYDGFTFEQFMRWQWFFRYRAALLQIKYPRKRVHNLQTRRKPQTDKEKAAGVKNRLVARKRKITEITNKIRLAEENWNELFPIEEDSIYRRAKKKLERIEKERDELQEEYNQLTK